MYSGFQQIINDLPREHSHNPNSFSLNTKTNTTVNTYQVTLNGETHIINAISFDEIIRNIKQKFHLSANQTIRINFWSDEFREWIFLDSFPPDKTKLQVLVLDKR